MIDFAAAMTVYQGELIVGGSAALSDGSASANWSRWGPTHDRGDFDGDRVADLLDFVQFRACLAGPQTSGEAAPASECLCAFNREGDADIDLIDFAMFQTAFTPPRPK